MAKQPDLGLYFAVLRVLEQTGAPYVIIGAFAGVSCWALGRRIRRRFMTEADEPFEAWCARPEDVVVGKLMAWREGRSTKHEWDIRDILAAARLGEDELSRGFDLEYVDDWARQLGPDVELEWRGLKGQA
jgi:hypothetical protein